jgi:hypothetical protein
LILGAVLLAGGVSRGHTPITSRYNYNEHLFPIFRDRCGACHVNDGIAPMSLVTYKEAFPWAQSIREEVLALRMPPWRAEDGFGDFRNGHALSAREMDMILEWSSGGYPPGPRALEPTPVDTSPRWELGAPSLRLEMPAAFQIAADTSEVVRFFVLPSQTNADRWIKAVDFMPGARPVVRDVVVYIDATGKAKQLDAADAALGFAPPADGSFPTSQPIAVWVPGQTPVVLGETTAYKLPRATDIVLRMHYKKTWITDGQPFADRSAVGVYFAEGNPRAVETMIIPSPSTLSGRQAKFTQTMDRDVTALALLPEVGMEMGDVQVEAVRPDGTREPMLLLREPSGAWPTRYWFEAPVVLAKGTQVEVTAVLKPGGDRLSAASLLAGAPQQPIRLLMDFVSGGASAAN